MAVVHENLSVHSMLIQAGGSHLGSDFNNQIGSSMQIDRGSWMSGPLENPAVTQLPGPPAAVSSQMGPGNQPLRPSSVFYLAFLNFKLA